MPSHFSVLDLCLLSFIFVLGDLAHFQFQFQFLFYFKRTVHDMHTPFSSGVVVPARGLVYTGNPPASNCWHGSLKRIWIDSNALKMRNISWLVALVSFIRWRSSGRRILNCPFIVQYVPFNKPFFPIPPPLLLNEFMAAHCTGSVMYWSYKVQPVEVWGLPVDQISGSLERDCSSMDNWPVRG